MRYIMDRTGKILAFDGEKLSFKLLKFISDDEAVYFCSRTETLFCGGRDCYIDELGDRFIVGHVPSNDIKFERLGCFLSIYSSGILIVSNSEGRIRISDKKILESLFFLLPENLFHLLDYFFGNGISYIGEKGKREIKVHDFIIYDGINKFSLEKNIHASLRDERIILVAEEFSLIEVKKFNPLIYFCAFGGQEYLDNLFLSIRSYIMFSKVRLNFIIFTNIDDVDLPSDLKYAPISFVRLSSVATISRYYKRYSAEVADYFHEYSPIIYSDTDIICNNDISEMLYKIHSSHKFYIACECGRRTKEFVLRSGWFIGSFLTRDKTVPEDDVYPINSGFFAFRSVQEFTLISRMMTLIASHIIKMEGFHHNALDQAALNYILLKFCDHDCHYLNDIVITWPDSDFNKIKRLGIVHFCGHGNLLRDFGKKEDGIKAYFNHVQSLLEEDRKAAALDRSREELKRDEVIQTIVSS